MDSQKVMVNVPSINSMESFIDNFSNTNIQKISEEEREQFYKNIWYERVLNGKTETYVESVEGKEKEIKKEREVEKDKEIEKEKEIEKYLMGFVKDEIVIHVCVTLYMLVSLLFFCVTYNLSFLKHYCYNLKKEIDNSAHIWMGNKSLNDILISVNITSENLTQKIDLCSYIRKEITDKKCEKKIVWLLGQPGEGKTVALKKIALMLIEERNFSLKKVKRINKIPLLLSITDLEVINTVESLENELLQGILRVYRKKLPQFIFSIWRNRFAKVFISYLKNGKYLLLFDGYDEVNENNRHVFVKTLEKFTTKYDNCRVIISSRDYVFHNDNNFLLQEGAIVHLTSFTREQIYEFIYKWNFNKKEMSELYMKIIMNIQLEHLAQNPFLLTLICYMYEKKAQIDKNTIADFYLEASNCLLKSWEAKKKIQNRVHIEIETKEEALACFAYFMVTNQRSWCGRKDAILAMEQCAKEYGVETGKILDEICIQSGILEESIKKEYHFYHRSFLEFYTAIYYKEKKLDIAQLEDELEQNSHIIFFYLSLCSDLNVTHGLLNRHKDKRKFIRQILRECSVHDEQFIIDFIKAELEALNPTDTESFKELGEFAHKYPYVKNEIREHLTKNFTETESIFMKQNSIVALAHFEDAVMLARLVAGNFASEDVVKLVIMADEAIDEVIFHLMEEVEEKYIYDILQGIAKEHKYDLLLRMLIGTKNIKKRELIIGTLLHLTKEKTFLIWLETKELIKYEDEEVAEKIWQLIYAYKWCNNELSRIQIQNMYVIAWYALQLLENPGYKFNKKKIDNRLKYLITYIKNAQNKGTVNNYLIDIKGFKVKSLVEFQYHWRKAEKKVSGFGKNPIILRYINIYVIGFTNLGLLAYYLLITSDYRKIIRLRWKLQTEIAYSFFENGQRFKAYDQINLDISRYLEYNALYFLFVGVLIMLQILLHKVLIRLDFKMKWIWFHFLIFLASIAIYVTVIQEPYFRLAHISISFVLMCIEIIHHKNNYPSFLFPQFNKIRDFLRT